MKRAVYAGSFDPITNGHVHVIKKAAALFDEVIVVVAQNPAKAGSFNPNERVKLCEKALIGTSKARVDAQVVTDVYVVDYAERIKATHLVRGLPTVADFTYEYELYHNNRTINPKIDTAFIMCDKDVQQVRSSTVRGMVGYRGWMKRVKPLVPSAVFEALLLRHMEKEWLRLAPKVSYLGSQSFQLAWPHVSEMLTHRPYHNLEHVQTMLDGLAAYEEELGTLKENRALLKVAIWLHDIVVSSNENKTRPADWPTINDKLSPEMQSAEYARLFMQRNLGGRSTSDADLVHDLIVATDYSAPRERNSLQKLLCCLDCVVLAGPRDEYEAYAEAIRQEYTHSGCGLSQFIYGRIGFLKKMWGDPNNEIMNFFGDLDFAHLKETTLANVRREMEELSEEYETY